MHRVLQEDILKVARKTFQKEQDIVLQTNRKDCLEWDSLNHLRLFMELEQHFQYEFNSQELSKLDSLEKIFEHLKQVLKGCNSQVKLKQ